MAESDARDAQGCASAAEARDGREQPASTKTKQVVDAKVSREDWLADKRAVLHSRMRERRRSRATSGAWKVSLW